MQPSEYFNKFDATASSFYQQNPDPRAKANCALLGLLSEVSEFLEVPSPEELGDVIWYHAMFVKQCGWNDKAYDAMFVPASACPTAAYLNSHAVLVRCAGKIASYFKKSIEKHRPVQENDVLQLALDVAQAILESASLLGFRGGVGDLMQQNLAKLSARHPKGFDPNVRSADEAVQP